MRLFDIESMSRIAHIDRPAGARGSLYPTISSLRPSLLFERSDSLLVGWGDCLMGMQVLTASPAPTASADGGPPPKVAHPKSVSMTMAWELDCVACDVVPLDETHVAVLGLVPAAPGDADDLDAAAVALVADLRGKGLSAAAAAKAAAAQLGLRKSRVYQLALDAEGSS